MAAGKWATAALADAARKAAMQAALVAAELILTEAINETPLDTGTLRRSATVTVGGPPPEGSGIFEAAQAGTAPAQSAVPVGPEQAVYISFNTPYAFRQHEEMDWQHVDGKAKYLEDPFKRQAPAALKRIQAAVAQALNSRS